MNIRLGGKYVIFQNSRRKLTYEQTEILCVKPFFRKLYPVYNKRNTKSHTPWLRLFLREVKLSFRDVLRDILRCLIWSSTQLDERQNVGTPSQMLVSTPVIHPQFTSVMWDDNRSRVLSSTRKHIPTRLSFFSCTLDIFKTWYFLVSHNGTFS